ncbi:hypothetical protein WMY93_023296 [Mugilogobius chulae]|uniref:BEN domain-containing protein n=1 Tax=Mugilogobius chulae TaxID=88201 RepID=A0AAW0N8T4_9GOBI
MRKPNSKWTENEKEETQRLPKKQKTKRAPCPAKEAADQMIEDLKRDLWKQQKGLESASETSDEDQTPRNWSSKLQQIRQLRAEASRRQYETDCRSNQRASSNHTQSTPVQPSSPASPQVESDEMVPLVPSSDIKVAKQKLKTLRSANPSVYIGDLAVIVFARETLAGSSLTGRPSGAHKDVESKPKLDPLKVDAVIGHALSKFPAIKVQDVRRILRKKCNNENFKISQQK